MTDTTDGTHPEATRRVLVATAVRPIVVITDNSDLARILVSVQTIADIVLIGTAVRILSGSARDAQPTANGHDESAGIPA